MAEGAGMAMEDAVVLAEELSASADIEKALDAYVKRRKPRVTWVQSQCNVRDKVRSWPSLARAAVLRLFGSSLYKRSYSPLLRSI
jgi:2-polyprenyl-6-methoxyphenol hydroxylase-like FAD-dependent oxidoreductase